METKIENITVKSNPRTDFGDIDELTASVREKGIIEPLVVKDIGNGKFELIAGERRLRAAKAAGLETVPVTTYAGDDTTIEEVKLIENIHRKDFNPIEEAKAFRQYLDITKCEIDTLAAKISKPKIYIERRLAILDLPSEAAKALQDGKILIGHALLLARMNDAKTQKKVLKDIIQNKRSVAETESRLQYDDSTISLERAVFDTSRCKGCKHNGGEQSLLFESGAELKNRCLDRKCFTKRTGEWKQEQTEALQKKGIKVLSASHIDKLAVKEQVYTWQNDYKAIIKKLPKEPENYAVVFRENYEGRPEKEIYCLNPKARHPKKQQVTDDKEKAKKASNKLNDKVQSFKRTFHISRIQEFAQPGTKQTKAMALFAMLKSGRSYEDRDKHGLVEEFLEERRLTEDSGCYSPVSFSKILSLDEKEIDNHIATVSTFWSNDTGSELDQAADAFGVNLMQHFTITEDYLKLHTKDQLVELAKEIGLDKHLQENGLEKWDKAKRTDLISYFLEQGFDLKGKVPKLMQAEG